MYNPVTYPWQTACVFAILETDEVKMRRRLYEAIAAIEQRRLSQVNSDEELALTDAEAGLQILISEAAAKIL
jgi:hypothetical protein